MTTGERLKQLRKELGISQEAIGAQGFISAPGWIKLENGQRQPSEKLIRKLYDYVKERHGYSEDKAHKLKVELLLLKYGADPLKFTGIMAAVYATRYKIDVLAKDSTNPKKPHARTARPQKPRKKLALA